MSDTKTRNTAFVTRKYPRGESKDSLAYIEELDWYFNCWEALIGYRSSLGVVLASSSAMSTNVPIEEGMYRPREPKMAIRTVMAKGRLVFARYRQLDTRDQIALDRYYSGRNVSEIEVAHAHRSYLDIKS